MSETSNTSDTGICPYCECLTFLDDHGRLTHHLTSVGELGRLRPACAGSGRMPARSILKSGRLHSSPGLGDPVEESSPESGRRMSTGVAALVSRHNDAQQALEKLLNDVLERLALSGTDLRILAGINKDIRRALGQFDKLPKEGEFGD